jgi:hypothetical protein
MGEDLADIREGVRRAIEFNVFDQPRREASGER